MGKAGMGDRETSNINIEIGRLSYAKQRLFNTFNISTKSLKIWKFKDKRAVGISINEKMGCMTYWSITAQQERRSSQRKGQKQIRAICSQPRIWDASRTDEISTTNSLPAHYTLKGNQEICCT